jgi:hypothetical protein
MERSRMKTIMTTLAAALLLAGCRDPVENTIQVCDDYAAAGLNVTAADSITGNAIATPVVVVAREGTFTDTRTLSEQQPIAALAWERAGTYTVEISAQGYLLWRRFGVRVDEDECHVIPVVIHAKLQRAAN